MDWTLMTRAAPQPRRRRLGDLSQPPANRWRIRRGAAMNSRPWNDNGSRIRAAWQARRRAGSSARRGQGCMCGSVRGSPPGAAMVSTFARHRAPAEGFSRPALALPTRQAAGLTPGDVRQRPGDAAPACPAQDPHGRRVAFGAWRSSDPTRRAPRLCADTHGHGSPEWGLCHRRREGAGVGAPRRRRRGLQSSTQKAQTRRRARLPVVGAGRGRWARSSAPLPPSSAAASAHAVQACPCSRWGRREPNARFGPPMY